MSPDEAHITGRVLQLIRTHREFVQDMEHIEDLMGVLSAQDLQEIRHIMEVQVKTAEAFIAEVMHVLVQHRNEDPTAQRVTRLDQD